MNRKHFLLIPSSTLFRQTGTWFTCLLMLTFLIMGCSINKQTASIKTIVDTEPPVFVSFPENIIDTCGHASDFGTPVAQDNSGKHHLTFIDSKKGNCEEGLTITRTWSVIDASKNQTTRQQIIRLLPNNKIELPPILDDKLYLVLNEQETQVMLRFLRTTTAEKEVQPEKVRSTIYDLNGHTMFEMEKELPLGEHNESVDITGFPKGIYFVMLKDGGKWLSAQFEKRL